MLRCLTSSRFAVRSSAGRLVPTPLGCLYRWQNLRIGDRGQSTALAGRRQDDTALYTPTFSPSLASTSDYLDFILSDRDGEPSDGAAQAGKRKASPKQVNSTPRASSRSKKAKTALRSKPTPIKMSRVHSQKWKPKKDSRPRLTPVVKARVTARLRAKSRFWHERPRSISLRSASRTSAVFSSSWNVLYNSISTRYDSAFSDTYLQEVQAPHFQPQTAEWVKSLLAQMRGPHDKLNVEGFARTHGKLGREVWSEVALWLMYNDNDRLLDFLIATHTSLYPPINWVEDCFSHLSRHYSHLPERSRERGLRRLAKALLILVRRDTNEQFAIRSSFFRHLLPYSAPEQVNELYGVIKSRIVQVHPYTLHHFSDWFGQNGHVEQSLDALLEAAKFLGTVQSLPFRKNCAALLRRCMQHPGGLRVCLRIIENLVSIGVTLNMQLCNIIMLNAVESRDLEVMRSVHSSALGQGLRSDAHTCAIVLKACKLDIDDADNLRLVIQEAIENGDVRHNVVLSTEILHCLALHHTKHNPETAYATVSEAYLQLFDAAPLERLGLRMPSTARRLESGEQPMAPSNHALCFVVASFLNHTASAQDAQRLYTTWRSLVEAGDPAVASLATASHFANLFMHKFCRAKSSLLQAAAVVKDMQKALPASAGVKQCEPDVYTWSIFLDGFARKSQMRLAEQVLTYMRSKDMEPNQVTWNSLLGGYAAAQDVEGTLDALRRLEGSGATYDEWTAGGLGRLRDQQRLREELEKQRFEQSMDFTRDIKRDLEAKFTTPGDDAEVDVLDDWEGSQEAVHGEEVVDDTSAAYHYKPQGS